MRRQRELMHVLSASRTQTLRYLLIPSALPYLFAGFKIAAPSAVLGAITAEWAGADRGVGAMMLYALFSYDTPKVWLSVLLTCLLAAGGYGLWSLWWNGLCSTGTVTWSWWSRPCDRTSNSHRHPARVAHGLHRRDARRGVACPVTGLAHSALHRAGAAGGREGLPDAMAGASPAMPASRCRPQRSG